MLGGHKNKKPSLSGVCRKLCRASNLLSLHIRHGRPLTVSGQALPSSLPGLYPRQRLCPCAAHPTQRTLDQAHGLIPGAKNAKTRSLLQACGPTVSVHDCACTPASPDDPAHDLPRRTPAPRPQMDDPASLTKTSQTRKPTYDIDDSVARSCDAPSPGTYTPGTRIVTRAVLSPVTSSGI